MLELEVPTLPTEWGARLTTDDYDRDFGERFEALRGLDSWKLERLQHFEEESPSRDALRRGDWDEALRLIEARRDGLRLAALKDGRRGAVFHRLRVVEEPLTPYVQWELHSLRQRAEFGQRIRVLPAEYIASAEADGPLPELVILGGQAMYRVLYTEAGVPDGAIRFTDPEIVDPWVAYVQQAYAAAEDIETYFERAVAHLPPPPAA